MPRHIVTADSSPLSDDDTRKHELVKKLIVSENKTIREFAKHLATMAFSSIGVVLALQDKWVGQHPTCKQKLLLAAALMLYLISASLSSLAAGIYAHRVSLSDYGDIDTELHRVAKFRHRLTRFGLIFIAAGTIVVAIVAFWS